jgi:hypothetical protein
MAWCISPRKEQTSRYIGCYYGMHYNGFSFLLRFDGPMAQKDVPYNSLKLLAIRSQLKIIGDICLISP